jgi:hypothetical protein
MGSDYEKTLEDTNARLIACLERAEEEADGYKRYVDLLKNGNVTEWRPYATEDDGWMPHIPKKDVKQQIRISICVDDVDDYPILNERVERYIDERKRINELREESEIRWERRKQIIMISAIVIGVIAAICGISWLVWAAYFIPL